MSLQGGILDGEKLLGNYLGIYKLNPSSYHIPKYIPGLNVKCKALKEK